MTHSEAGRLGALKSAGFKARQRNNALAEYNANPKRCMECARVLAVNGSESLFVVKRKTFCGRSCSARFNNRRFPKRVAVIRYCLECGQRTPSARSAFCGDACKLKRRRQRRGDVPLSHEMARNDLIALHGAKCSKCGWGKINPRSGRCPIILNHIDGNSENMSWNNLELLCPNCDSLTPTYKALNKGNGRHARKMRYRNGKSH